LFADLPLKEREQARPVGFVSPTGLAQVGEKVLGPDGSRLFGVAVDVVEECGYQSGSIVGVLLARDFKFLSFVVVLDERG